MASLYLDKAILERNQWYDREGMHQLLPQHCGRLYHYLWHHWPLGRW